MKHYFLLTFLVINLQTIRSMELPSVDLIPIIATATSQKSQEYAINEEIQLLTSAISAMKKVKKSELPWSEYKAHTELLQLRKDDLDLCKLDLSILQRKINAQEKSPNDMAAAFMTCSVSPRTPTSSAASSKTKFPF